MKKILITKELKVLPEQLQKRLLAQIGKDMVEIICINQKQSAQLLIVTVVLAKLVTAHEKQLFAKKDNMHAKFIFPVFEMPDGSFDRAQYGQYWDSCRENLQLQWQQISDAANSKPASAHVTILCRIFIALCHAFVYRTACYLPHLRNPQYAWKMLQWAQPDFVRLHITDHHVAEIFALFADSSLQPTSENKNTQTIDCSRFGMVLQVCSSLYEHAERLYNE